MSQKRYKNLRSRLIDVGLNRQWLPERWEQMWTRWHSWALRNGHGV